MTLPVSVNVVPGDQAAGRVPDPKVRTELLFQQAQEAKRRAADAIARGDDRAAYDLLARRGRQPRGRRRGRAAIVLPTSPPTSAAGAAARAAKRSRMEHHRKSRKRGQRCCEVSDRGRAERPTWRESA